MNGKKRLGRGLEALLSGEGVRVITDKNVSDKLESDKTISDQLEKDTSIAELKAREEVEEKANEIKSEEVISDKLESDEEFEIIEKMISETVTSDKLKIDNSVVLRALEEGKKNPRVVVWSPKSSVVLRILKKTIPEFSISHEASKLLEEAIKEKYPEIWRIVENIMKD